MFTRVKFKLQTRILIFFTLIASSSLVAVNYLWFNSSRNQILKSAASNLNIKASDLAHQVEGYLEVRQLGLIIHSQTQSVLSGDILKVTSEFQDFLLQDRDLQELTLIGQTGKELVRLSRARPFAPEELVDQSTSLAYKIPTFLGGERYISSIYIDEENEPGIYIAVPVVKPETPQDLLTLRTSMTGKPLDSDKILGVIKANYRLTSLWRAVENSKIGKNGYLFLINQQGDVLAHPRKIIERSQKNLKGVAEVDKVFQEVALDGEPGFETKGETVKETLNEFGVLSLTSHARVNPTNWAVIAEIPVSDTLANTNQVALFAAIIFAVIVAVVSLISVLVSKRIIRPIDKLREGSRLIGKGDLNYRLDIKTGDEIEDLALEFNNMAGKLQKNRNQLEEDRGVIAAERNKLALILESVRDGVVAVDLNQRIVLLNAPAQKILGLDLKKAQNQRIDSIIKIYEGSKILPPEIYCPIRADKFEGTLFSRGGLKLVSASGRELTVELSAGKIKEGTNINLGTIITIHDLSEEKHLEEMKLDFVSMAAHELRTPVTSIRGYLELLKDEAQTYLSVDHQTFVNRSLISCNILSSLIDNLLNITKIEQGTLKLNKEETDLSSLIEESIEILKPRAKEKNINLRFQKNLGKMPLILVDKFRITEVIENLISNAVNYTQPSGSVEVSLEEKGGELIIEVKDNGPGIPQGSLAHLFTKFYRVSGALESGSKGTGLGLFISKSIVDLHHGKIWVKSQLGQGSTFGFSLPLTKTPG